MTDATDTPQIYLITPSDIDLLTFPDTLAACLDMADVACVRLAMGTQDEDRITRAADALREVTHARDVALVIDTHIQLVDRLGLDGVHLLDGARSVKKTRKELGDDAIVGAFCGNSSHDGMTAGELNADYISFGPVGESVLGDGEIAAIDLFAWWSQMIEVPVVAEGKLTLDLLRAVAPHTDFIGLGDELWTHDDPQAVLGQMIAAMH